MRPEGRSSGWTLHAQSRAKATRREDYIVKLARLINSLFQKRIQEMESPNTLIATDTIRFRERGPLYEYWQVIEPHMPGYKKWKKDPRAVRGTLPEEAAA